MMGSRGLAIAVALFAGGFMLHCWSLAAEPMQLFSPGVLTIALLFWANLLWRLPDTPLHRSSLCALVGGTMVGVAVQRHMLGAHWVLTLLDAATSVVYWCCWRQQLRIMQLQTMVEGAQAARPEMFAGPEEPHPEDEYDNDPANWVAPDVVNGGNGDDAYGSSLVIALDEDYGDAPAVYFGLDGNPIGYTAKKPAAVPPPPSVDVSIPERKLDRRKP